MSRKRPSPIPTFSGYFYCLQTFDFSGKIPLIHRTRAMLTFTTIYIYRLNQQKPTKRKTAGTTADEATPARDPYVESGAGGSSTRVLNQVCRARADRKIDRSSATCASNGTGMDRKCVHALSAVIPVNPPRIHCLIHRVVHISRSKRPDLRLPITFGVADKRASPGEHFHCWYRIIGFNHQVPHSCRQFCYLRVTDSTHE